MPGLEAYIPDAGTREFLRAVNDRWGYEVAASFVAAMDDRDHRACLFDDGPVTEAEIAALPVWTWEEIEAIRATEIVEEEPAVIEPWRPPAVPDRNAQAREDRRLEHLEIARQIKQLSMGLA